MFDRFASILARFGESGGGDRKRTLEVCDGPGNVALPVASEGAVVVRLDVGGVDADGLAACSSRLVR